MSKKSVATTDLVILGAGNVDREIFDIIHDINELNENIHFRILFLAEDSPKQPKQLLKSITVIDSSEVLHIDPEHVKLICAVGDPVRAKWIASFENAGFRCATLIHPSAIVFDWTNIGDGCIIYPGTFISTNVKIGRHVLIQANCSVMHDVEIGNYCTLCSGVHIGGYTKIGAASFIGIGATIVDRVTIGENVTIGAGSLTLQDIPKNVIAVGTPVRILKIKEKGEDLE